MTFTVVCLFALSATAAAVTVTPLTSGHTWLENLLITDVGAAWGSLVQSLPQHETVCVADVPTCLQGALFATELNKAQVLRITGQADGTYETEVWASLPAKTVLGLAQVPAAKRLYVVGESDSGTYAIWSFSTTQPQSYQQEAVVDWILGNGGNGLGVDPVTGMVYVSAEG